jgi:quinol monooxygenase YgiN
MPIYQTGGYQVKPSAVNKVKKAIREFVAHVQANEPGTQMYLAWQQKNDPTRFLHLFIFADEAAQTRHGQSEAVKRFESVYSPELVGGEVLFTDYELISGKPTPEQWAQWQNLFKSTAAVSKR